MDKTVYDDNFDAIDWGPKQVTTTIMINGKPVALNSNIKNRLYKRAKELKEDIRNGMCTKDECWNPTEVNIKKMINKEFLMCGKINAYRKAMETIGADPRDCETERLRKGGTCVL